MSERVVYYNGEFVPEREARVSIYDLGVTQGAAAFEMLRSFHGLHFKLAEHLDRLEASCRTLGIPVPCRTTLETIIKEITELNPHEPGDEHRLMIVASAGAAPMYQEIVGDSPTLYIADFPLRLTTAGMGRQFQEGGRAIIANTRQVPDACVPSWTKHRSRLHFHLAQAEATLVCADWAILLDHYGYVTECPGANVFMVRHSVLSTPDRGCLCGISGQYVLELADQLGIEHERAPISDSTLLQADEVFVTGTPFCLLPITWLNGLPIGPIGPVYRRLLAAWSESVAVDIAGQIMAWDWAATPRPTGTYA